MITGLKWNDHPHQSVSTLIRDIDAFYADHVTPKLGHDAHSLAAVRVVEHRRWQPSQKLFAPHLESMMRELGIRWVPKQMDMGPSILFPRYDTHQFPARASLRPVGWDLRFGDEPVKYVQMGSRYEFRGPSWIGNSDRVLEAMMRNRVAVLVEGPFDVLACRLVQPDIPTLTSGTKSINEMHLTYLAVLGVERIAFLFDNDRIRDGVAGAGQIAAEGKARYAKSLGFGFKTEVLRCPAQDPSACLERRDTAVQLKSLLEYAGEG